MGKGLSGARVEMEIQERIRGHLACSKEAFVLRADAAAISKAMLDRVARWAVRQGWLVERPDTDRPDGEAQGTLVIRRHG
jgi:hypothetical protein